MQHLKIIRIWSAAILTGITRISKESIFSDLNNLKSRDYDNRRICGLFRIYGK